VPEATDASSDASSSESGGMISWCDFFFLFSTAFFFVLATQNIVALCS
jgi:hypothetical protein